jgi:hypothetical protein
VTGGGRWRKGGGRKKSENVGGERIVMVDEKE